jgi:hypothetical protein
VSNTPKTDAKAQFFGWNPDEGEEFVQADFARELERENAALRADTERLDWLTNTGCWLTFPGLSRHQNWKHGTARDVIDLARKEAQP